MSYAPLDFVKNTIDLMSADYPELIPGKMYDTTIRKTLEVMGIEHTPSEEDYVKYCLSHDFLNMDSTNTIAKKLNPHMMKSIDFVMQQLGYNEHNIHTLDERSIITEMQDVHVGSVILDRWIRNKQVLKPDKTFASYLINTEKLEIDKDFFTNLPYTTFYVDLSDFLNDDDKLFGDIHGAFIDITKINDTDTAVTTYTLGESLLFYSHYMMFKMTNGSVQMDAKVFDTNMLKDVSPALHTTTHKNVSETVNVRAINMLVYQLIQYMKVKKPDVSTDVKGTYHPSEHRIKNKYNEILLHDVGINIGKTISKNREDALKNISAHGKTKNHENKSTNERKPITPHFRCAHWHKYWVGKGRNMCVVKWIAPVFVSGGNAKDITIHNVTE